MVHQDLIDHPIKSTWQTATLWLAKHQADLKLAIKWIVYGSLLFATMKLIVWLGLRFNILLPLSGAVAVIMGVLEASLTILGVVVGTIIGLGLVTMGLSLALRILYLALKESA